MRIVDLKPDDESLVRQVAAIMVEAFAEHWPEAWPDMESALEEVRESFDEGRISRVAVEEDDEDYEDEHGRQGRKALGWIGGIPEYRGKAWELHPLAVHSAYRRQGIGRALVSDLEEQVRQRGGLTVILGSDDVDNMTTLSGVDLYPDVLGHIGRIQNLKGHPYEFYRKLGYTITGVVPDANGPGKPDILMSKRVGGSEQPKSSETED